MNLSPRSQPDFDLPGLIPFVSNPDIIDRIDNFGVKNWLVVQRNLEE
jgi:hypothetical protein